jgi:hypothetical protein
MERMRTMKCIKLVKSVIEMVSPGGTAALVFVVLLAGIVSVSAAGEGTTKSNELVIRADEGRDTINRNIYGHFSEHLGRCIYGGFGNRMT